MYSGSTLERMAALILRVRDSSKNSEDKVVYDVQYAVDRTPQDETRRDIAARARVYDSRVASD